MKLDRDTMRLLLKFLIGWIAIYTVAISIYFVSHCQINFDHQDPGRSSHVHGNLLIGDNSNPGNQSPLEQTPATSVIILTYQRCGSSVFGSVFRSNPNFFYTYEPLDALYSHMYGTEMGWNVPSDIRSYKDGTPRSIPEKEKTHIVQMLDQLINCRTDSLPAEFFDHPIYQRLKPEHPSMFPFLRCLRTKKIKLDVCRKWRKRVEIYCGYRFGNMSEDTLSECNSRLTGIETGPHSVFSWISYFHDYRTCRDEFVKKSYTCVPMLERLCASKRSRVFKIVRATMETLEPLLKIHPELRIIHLLRDPRGVALSRSVFESGRGIYSGNDSNTVGLEAELFCRDVVEDINSRMKLEQRYPGRFYTVFYDDFAVDPQKHTDDIYRFIGTAVPPSTRSTIRRILTPYRKSNLTSKMIAEKWKTKIRHSENQDVIKACKGFFSLFDRKWDMYV